MGKTNATYHQDENGDLWMIDEVTKERKPCGPDGGLLEEVQAPAIPTITDDGSTPEPTPGG